MVDKLLRNAGEVLAYQDAHVRGVKANRIQCDEVGAFDTKIARMVAGEYNAKD